MIRSWYIKISSAILCVLCLTAIITGCQVNENQNTAINYSYTDHSFERNGVKLHLDCIEAANKKPQKQILLTHGVTYSSHEFDIDYEDYSLVRFLVSEGYAVWRLDIAGFGQSGEVKDGFMPDSDYAADDISAAVDNIISTVGKNKIDLLGWSWGTVTASRYIKKSSEHINKLVLYAPILSGIGKGEVNEAFHHNTWEHAADDFQHNESGDYDLSITDPVMINMFCSSCWRYDKEHSPNGGRKDLCVDKSKELIDLSAIKVQTLIICGSNDPYLNYDLINTAQKKLPEGSQTKVISGGAHVIMYEKPYYHEFQKELKDFLTKN